MPGTHLGLRCHRTAKQGLQSGQRAGLQRAGGYRNSTESHRPPHPCQGRPPSSRRSGQACCCERQNQKGLGLETGLPRSQKHLGNSLGLAQGPATGILRALRQGAEVGAKPVNQIAGGTQRTIYKKGFTKELHMPWQQIRLFEQSQGGLHHQALEHGCSWAEGLESFQLSFFYAIRKTQSQQAHGAPGKKRRCISTMNLARLKHQPRTASL